MKAPLLWTGESPSTPSHLLLPIFHHACTHIALLWTGKEHNRFPCIKAAIYLFSGDMVLTVYFPPTGQITILGDGEGGLFWGKSKGKISQSKN